jgi:hypothetical protein
MATVLLIPSSRRLAGRLGGSDARLLRSPPSESPAHLRVSGRMRPVVRARHALRGTAARRTATVEGQQVILPRGQIPLYDETAFDDATASMLELLGDADRTAFDQDPAEYSQSRLKDDNLRRYRERLRGSKPHGGASVTALAIDRKEDEEALCDSLVSGGVDSSLAVHDMATGALIMRRHNAHGVSSVLCLAVMAVERQKRVISGGQGNNIIK